MSLYHRTYTRIPLTLDVELKCKGKYFKRASTRDVDPFGAFIKLPSPELQVNDFVNLSFINKYKGDNCVAQKGIVVHASEEGVGILFANDTEEFRSMLDKVLSHEASSPIKIQLRTQ